MIRSSATRFLTLLGVCLWFAGAANCVLSHPMHESMAEAEYNPETGKLEVALRLNPIDLERALRRKHLRAIDLDKTPGVEQMIRDYVAETWQVRDGKQLSKLEWVGHELEVQEAWVYFELPLGRDIGRWTFRCRLFLELQPDQVNTVNLRRDGTLKTLVFQREEG